MNKEQIIFGLINTEYYKEFLSSAPHREFHDLSIAYYELGQDKKRATLITNQAADEQDLSEQELYELAMKNTKEWSSPTVKKVSDLFKKFDEEIKDELPEEQEIYVITNECYQLGAISILYEDVLDKVAKIVGTDLYLLPSSEHEFLAVTVNGPLTVDELQELVHYVNITQVKLDERLSNQVYHYDMTTKEITQATHSQYTALNSVRDEWSDRLEEVEDFAGDKQMGMELV